MKKSILFIFCFFLFANKSIAQNNDSQAFLYNITTNALVGGIGAALNKKKKEKLSRVLLKGVGQGALGGYLVFESKRIVRRFSRTENYGLLWPSKILNSAGNSITLNASENRNFWERWHLNVGFNHIEYDIKRTNRWTYRIMPFSLIGAIDFSLRGQIDFNKSILSGNFVFVSENLFEAGARAFANNIIYDKNSVNAVEEIALAHEIIHVYQYESWVSLRAYFNKPNSLVLNESRFLKTYNKYFFSDWNYLVHIIKRESENLFVNSRLQTPTEQEAFYWTDDFRNPHN